MGLSLSHQPLRGPLQWYNSNIRAVCLCLDYSCTSGLILGIVNNIVSWRFVEVTTRMSTLPVVPTSILQLFC